MIFKNYFYIATQCRKKIKTWAIKWCDSKFIIRGEFYYIECIPIFSKTCDVRMKSFGVLRVYRSYGMSNNKAITMILFMEGAGFQMWIRVVFLMSMRRQCQWSTIIITLTFLLDYSLCDDSWLRFSSYSYVARCFITVLFYAEVLPETSSGQDNRNLNSANEDNQNLGKDEIEALRKDGLSGEVC